MTLPVQQVNQHGSAVIDPMAGGFTAYNQQAAQATTQTNTLADSVDRLENKLSTMRKNAGQKLINIGAADAATVTGMTSAAALYDKQLSTLNATAAITPLNMGQVRKSLDNTFGNLPNSRTEIASLATQISNLGVTGARNLGPLVTTMLKLEAATGEPASGLAQGLIQLSRLMGNSDAGKVAGYANSLLTVSKNAGVSATGVLSFAQSIAPLARQAGIGESSILGISAAFSKAGADGFVAANTFNSVVSDITNLTQSGSPELSKYANLIGVTVGQFKKMDKTTALTDIFETVAKQGPAAINTLNRLGIDGVRAQSAIAAVVQSGDLRKNIAQAQGSSGNTANLDKAAGAARGGLTDQLARMRNEVTQMMTDIGVPFEKAATVVAKAFATILHAAEPVVHVLSPILGLVAGLAGAFSALGGGVLLAGGLLAKLTLAGFVGRSSPVQGFLAGRNTAMGNQYGRGQQQMADRYAAGTLRGYQRRSFETGARYGNRSMAAEESFRATNAERAAAGMAPLPRGVGVASRVAAMPLRAGTWAVNQQEGYVNDARLNGAARPPGFTGWVGARASSARTRVSGLFGRGTSDAAASTDVRAAEARVAADTRVAAAADGSAKAQIGVGAAAKDLSVSLLRLERSTLRTGMSVAGQGAGMGLRAAGRGIASIATDPMMLGLIAVPAAMGLISHLRDHSDAQNAVAANSMNPLQKMNDQLGIATTNLADFSNGLNAANPKKKGVAAGTTLAEASSVTGDDMSKYAAAKPTDKTIAALGAHNRGNVAAAVALGRSYDMTDPRQVAAFKNNLISSGFSQPNAQKVLDQLTSGGTKITTAPSYGSLAGAIRASEGGGNLTNAPSTSGGRLTASGLTRIGTQYNTDAASHTAGYASTKQLQAALNFLSQLGKGQTGAPNQTRAQINDALAILTGGKAGDFESVEGGPSHRSSGAMSNYGGPGNMTNSPGTPLGTPQGIMAILQRTASGRRYLASVTGAGGVVDPSKFDSYLGAHAKLVNREDPYTRNVRGSGGLGSFELANSTVQKAYNAPQDPAQQYSAMMAIYNQAGGAKASPAKLNDAFDRLEGAVKDTSDQLYVMTKAAGDYAKQQEQYAMPYKSRVGQLQTSAADYTEAYRANRDHPTADTPGKLQAAQSAYEAQKQGYQQYMLATYQQAEQFGTQMTRAQQDQDTQIERSHRDHYRQMADMQVDYQRQTYRATRDYGIQLQQQAQTQAQSIYNPFTRVQAQYTSDAGTVVQNLEDQNKRIKDQRRQLDELSHMGVSKGAIQTLDLANPNNAQQTNNLVSSLMQNPALIKQINQQAATRLQATTSLTQNSFSLQFQQGADQFKRSMHDAAEDNARTRERSTRDFNTSMGDMAADFDKMMRRSRTDLGTQMRELYGDFGKSYTSTVAEINKTIGKYAPQLSKTLIAEISKARAAVNAAAAATNPATAGPYVAGSANAAEHRMGYATPATVSPVGTGAGGYSRLLDPRVGGHAMGGISRVDHLARFSEGNKAELMVPLDQRGLGFMAQFTQQVSMAMLRTMVGRSNPLMPTGQGGGADQRSFFDYSTTYSGDIHVVADDPKAMQAELDKRKRVNRLASPARK